MRRLILMISAAVVAVAACGGSSPTEGAEGAQEAGEEPVSVAAFFGFDPSDPDASAANFARLNMRHEELVATCMVNQGFEYVPAVVPVDTEDFVFDEEEYARERGFGISTSEWLTDGSTGVDGVSVDFTVESGSAEQWVDPNDAIVEALSDSEREAYNNALYGEPTDLEFGSDLSDPESETADDIWGRGCMGEADREIYGGVDEVYQEIGPMFEELQQRIESDPRVVEARQKWTACMADRGYDFQTVEELWERGLDEISTRYRELVNFADPFAGWTDEQIEIFFETQSAEAISDFYEQNQSEARQDVDQEALAALQQEEKDLAVANYECGEEQREIEQEVTQDLESQFIADNRDILEQARASLDLS